PGRRRSTRRCRPTERMQMKAAIVGLGALALHAALPAAAEDLMQVYRDAQKYDAVFSGARFALEAGREKLPQGRALVLPTLNLTANYTHSRISSETRDPVATTLTFMRDPYARGYVLTFTQPLLRLQNVAQYSQAEYQ